MMFAEADRPTHCIEQQEDEISRPWWWRGGELGKARCIAVVKQLHVVPRRSGRFAYDVDARPGFILSGRWWKQHRLLTDATGGGQPQAEDARARIVAERRRQFLDHSRQGAEHGVTIGIVVVDAVMRDHLTDQVGHCDIEVAPADFRAQRERSFGIGIERRRRLTASAPASYRPPKQQAGLFEPVEHRRYSLWRKACPTRDVGIRKARVDSEDA